nr:hypothetical protein [Tanacetum cinerariifolium]
MPPRMTTRSASRSTAAPRGGRTGGRTGRGIGRIGEPMGRVGGRTGDQDGQGGDQDNRANKGVDKVLDFSMVIAQQLQNLLSTSIDQVELKQRYFEDYCSDNQYAVSIKEDTAYLCLHSPKTTKETRSNTLDEIKPTNDETFDLEETDHDDEQEIDEIFKIETNLFDYKTPLCEEFKEFNYLLKIDTNLLTKDIEGFKTYKEFKDDWIYEWNNDAPWMFGVPACGWREDGYCNEGNFPGSYIIGNSLHCHDSEWYEALEDRELKEEALRNKSIMKGIINDDDESSYERQKR